MIPEQAVGSLLNASTALTAIVSTRISNGQRPAGTVLPCVNYFRMPGGIRANGFERISYSINCRAVKANDALAIARIITNIFHGSASTGAYGYINGFQISRSSLKADQGLIPETTEECYNAPVDILIVFPSSSVS